MTPGDARADRLIRRESVFGASFAFGVNACVDAWRLLDG